MDFPRALLIFFLFLFFYLALQLSLFFRIRDFLRRRVQAERRQKLLFGLVTFFFLLMLFPLAWRLIVFGFHLKGPEPWLVRLLFAVFAVWGFGSAVSTQGRIALRPVATEPCSGHCLRQGDAVFWPADTPALTETPGFL